MSIIKPVIVAEQLGQVTFGAIAGFLCIYALAASSLQKRTRLR